MRRTIAKRTAPTTSTRHTQRETAVRRVISESSEDGDDTREYSDEESIEEETLDEAENLSDTGSSDISSEPSTDDDHDHSSEYTDDVSDSGYVSMESQELYTRGYVDDFGARHASSSYDRYGSNEPRMMTHDRRMQQAPSPTSRRAPIRPYASAPGTSRTIMALPSPQSAPIRRNANTSVPRFCDRCGDALTRGRDGTYACRNCAEYAYRNYSKQDELRSRTTAAVVKTPQKQVAHSPHGRLQTPQNMDARARQGAKNTKPPSPSYSASLRAEITAMKKSLEALTAREKSTLNAMLGKTAYRQLIVHYELLLPASTAPVAKTPASVKRTATPTRTTRKITKN